MQFFNNEPAKFFFFFCDNTYPSLNIVVKNKMIQHKAVKIGSKNTQHNRFLIIHQCCGKSHAHSGQGHCLSQFHVEILIHDLCHNIQPAGGCISIKKNTKSHTDHQDIGKHIQLLAAGHRTHIRKYPLKQTNKYRQHNACINRFYSKLSSTGDKTYDQKYHIQNHSNCRQGKWYKIGQHNSKT